MTVPRHLSFTSSATRPTSAVLILSAGLVLAGCEEPPPEPPTGARPVKMFAVGDIEKTRVRDYPGTIRAAQTAEMAFEVPGRITEFVFKEGQQVQEGDVLAKIDPRDYVAELDKQKANLRKAQADLTRSRNIFKEDSGAISKEKISADERAVGVAQANLAVAEKSVEDAVLVAPFSGLMARKLVEDFQNVKAKEPVLILQDLEHLEIEISVPERDMTAGQGEMAPEQITETVKPRVVVSSIPGREFPARVKEMATTADPTTRTFQLKLIFERPDDVGVLPGMTARVVVEPQGQGGLMIPSHAARADPDGKAYVWLVDPDSMKVSRKPVELGKMSGEAVEIVSGLEKGEQVAISGVRQLADGMEVRRYESPREAQGS